MGKKKQHKTAQMQKKQEKKEVELYTVHAQENGKQIYPGKGVEKEQAELLAENLLQSTFVQLVE